MSVWLVFAQSMCIKLALPEAALVSIFFIGKAAVLQLWEGLY